jgi:PAS domain S-box-containing protein
MRRPPLSRPAATAGKRLQALSLNAFLTRLIWLCVLPLVILAGYLAINHVYTLQDQRDREAAHQVRNVATAIDLQLGAQIAALQMLAASPLADDPPRLHEFYHEAQGFHASFGGHVVLADRSMQMIFNTRAPFGAPLPKLPVPKGHAAAPAVLATGKPAVGDMFLGPIAKEPLVAVVAPLIRAGHTRFLLLSSIETRQFQHSLDEVALPAGWSLTVRDGNGEVMARRSPPEMEGRPADADPPGGFVAKSAVAHWSVALEVPRGVYRTPIIAAALALAAAILAVTLVSVLGGRLAGRRLARAVAALAGMPAPRAAHPVIAEIEAVRGLLEDSAAAREAEEFSRWESERRFRQLFDIAPAPLCFVNKHGALVNTNARFRETFGYGHDDVPTLAEWRQLAYPDPDYRRWVVETWKAALRRARENNTDIEPVEYRVTCKNGKVLTVVFSGTLLGDDFLATFFDITARKQAEKALRRYELLAAHSRDIILFMRRDDGRILEANAAATDAYGYSREQLLTMTIHELRSPDAAGLAGDQMEAADTRGILFETGHRRKDGSTFLVEVSSRGAVIEGTHTLISVVRDITERNQSVEALRNSLEEKVALLKEVHHRVKNNLQIVASLLGLQATRSSNQQVVDVLQDTRNRVKSMALLHEALYRSENLARINFATYVKDLCGQLLLSFGPAATRVKLENRVTRIGLPLEHAVPCGLIVSELVSNALKHGFPDERGGSISVGLEPAAGRMLVLSVQDDGVGLPSGLDPADTATLGLQLVSRLASQLGGQLKVETAHGAGAAFRVIFPVPEGTALEGES